MVGKFFALGGSEPYRHLEVWDRQLTTGPERLRIGGGSTPIDVLLGLSEVLQELLYVLVVLVVPRQGLAGRYESDALTRLELAEFFTEFGALFADDARADVWIGETEGNGLVLLEEHDLLYAYGNLEAFERNLLHRGYLGGVPMVPVPHEHHFNPELDYLEIGLGTWPWRRVLPLAEQDER